MLTSYMKKWKKNRAGGFSRGHLRFKAPAEWFMHHASFSLQKPSYWASFVLPFWTPSCTFPFNQEHQGKQSLLSTVIECLPSLCVDWSTMAKRSPHASSWQQNYLFRTRKSPSRSRRFVGSRVDWCEQGFGVRQTQVQPQLQHLAGWPRATCSTFQSCDCICRMVTRVTISQGSCSYVHHSKCSPNAHYFHYHWGILTKAQPPFLSLSLALTYTHLHN